jgi:hypothetical protein
MQARQATVLVVAILMVAAAFALKSSGLLVSEAEAADVAAGRLISSDAGATNVLTILPKMTYSIQCDVAACYKVGTAAAVPAPSCTTDALVPGAAALPSTTPTPTPYAFESAAATRVAAFAVDAGNPNCKVFLRTKNP